MVKKDYIWMIPLIISAIILWLSPLVVGILLLVKIIPAGTDYIAMGVICIAIWILVTWLTASPQSF